MLRLFSPAEGQALAAVAKKLDTSVQETLANDFDTSQEVSSVTPTYVPAVFVNIYGAIDDKNEALKQILTSTLPFVLKVQRDHRQSEKFDPSLTLSFNGVAGFVKQNPSQLNAETPYYIDADGTVKVNGP